MRVLFLRKSKTFVHLTSILGFLPRKQYRGFWILLIISIVVGIADLVFVGLIAKLVGSLSGSSLADNLPFIRVFGGDALNRGLWIVGILLALIWLSTGVKFYAKLIEVRVSADIWSSLGNLVYGNLILQDYDYFKSGGSIALLTRLNRVLSKVSDGVVLPIMDILSNVISGGILVIGVILAFGWIALSVFGLLIFSYAVASVLIAPRMRFLARQQFNYSRRVNEILYESTNSIRDVHLHGAELYFIDRFKSIGAEGKRYDRLAKIIPDLPRVVIEPTGVTVLLALGLVQPLLAGQGVDALRDQLPALIGVVFAALRLAAPIQSVFRAINKLRGSLPDLADALKLLSLSPKRLIGPNALPVTPLGVMPKYTIKLKNVWYRYSDSSDYVLKNINLTVSVGSRVALVGSTGGGKTTAAHLLLSLLRPRKGELLLDGIPLQDAEVQAWQMCCAFVPQNIKLLDASVRANVAFGISDELIDDNLLWECLEMAQLADFVSDLPYGALTRIGEDGMRFSGGQRQRLALARAFYKRAQVLVLDEATSALDNKTENEVMQSLELIGRRCTTIVIAHRLSTIRYCDRIYEFNQGRIVAHGTYDELQQVSPSFRELVNLQKS